MLLYGATEQELKLYLDGQPCKAVSLLYRALFTIEEELDAVTKSVLVEGILRQLRQMPVPQALHLQLVAHDTKGDLQSPSNYIDMDTIVTEIRNRPWLKLILKEEGTSLFDNGVPDVASSRSVDILHLLLWYAVVRTNDQFNAQVQAEFPGAKCAMKREWHQGVGGCPQGSQPQGGCCFRLEYTPSTAELWDANMKSEDNAIQEPRDRAQPDLERLKNVVFPSHAVMNHALEFVGQVKLGLIEKVGSTFTSVLAEEDCDTRSNQKIQGKKEDNWFRAILKKIWEWLKQAFHYIRDHEWTQTLVQGVRTVFKKKGDKGETTSWNIKVRAVTIGQKIATYIFTSPTVTLYLLAAVQTMRDEFAKWLGASFGMSVFGQALERSLHPLPTDSFQYSTDVVGRMRTAMATRVRFQDFAYTERFGLWNVLTHALEGTWGHYVVRAAQVLAPVRDAFGEPAPNVPDTPEGRKALDARLKTSDGWWDQTLFHLWAIPTRVLGSSVGSTVKNAWNTGKGRQVVAYASTELAAVAATAAVATNPATATSEAVAHVSGGASAASTARSTMNLVHQFVYHQMIIARVEEVVEMILSAIFGILTNTLGVVGTLLNFASFGWNVGSAIVTPLQKAVDYVKAPIFTIIRTMMVTLLLGATESWLVSLKILDNIYLLMDLLDFNALLSSVNLGLRTMCPRLYMHCAMYENSKRAWQLAVVGSLSGQDLVQHIAEPMHFFGAYSPSDLAFRPTIDVWQTADEAEKDALAVRARRQPTGYEVDPVAVGGVQTT